MTIVVLNQIPVTAATSAAHQSGSGPPAMGAASVAVTGR
jgi:hypothetical protein